MLPENGLPSPSAAERASVFYKQLTAAASDLNAASDELGKTIAALDAALKNLNLGISTWVRVGGSDDAETFWNREIGYTKIGKNWGIAIRAEAGYLSDCDNADVEWWLFNDAPRAYRLEAVDKIPELLEQLIKQAEDTTRKIKEKTSQAQMLAEAINQTAAETAGKRK
jgi:hypothetical protein